MITPLTALTLGFFLHTFVLGVTRGLGAHIIVEE